MKKTSIVSLALAALVVVPSAALAQDKPERERVHTTVSTPVDAVFQGCTEQVRVTGTLVTTVRASGVEGGRVHNVTHVRLTDARGVGLTSGAEYRVQDHEIAQRSYEFGGTQKYVANASQRVRVSGVGAGNDFVTNIKWQYRQDQDGNVVVSDLQIESGCKNP
jgi:hypothetical protein